MLLVIYFKIMTHILEDFFMLLDFSAVHLTLYFHNCCKETLRISTVTFKDTQSNSWLLFILLIFISCFILKQNATMPRSYTPWKQLYADLQYTYDDTIFLDLLLYLCVILVQKLINQLENPLKKKKADSSPEFVLWHFFSNSPWVSLKWTKSGYIYLPPKTGSVFQFGYFHEYTCLLYVRISTW